MRALVGPMSGQLEQAADQIMAATTDDAVRRAALRWKIEGVPALRKALFEPDPLSAVMDTWVLLNQMADYFEHGPGNGALGESAVTAVAACRRMEEDFTTIVGSMAVSGDVSRARAYARRWAAEHPIRHAIAGRETALGRVLEREAGASYSAGEVVAEVTTVIDDLGRRLEVYSDQLLRQARWEMESFRSEILSDLKMDQALPLAERAVTSGERAVAAADRLVPAVERTLGVVEGAVSLVERAVRAVEDTPSVLLGERDAVLGVLQDELTRTIQFVQQERIVALEHLTRERVAALGEMRETLVEERKALTREIEHLVLKVVDHAFWRAAQLLALLGVALLVALAAAALLARSVLRGARPGETAGRRSTAPS
jgi:hypothetical protein